MAVLQMQKISICGLNSERKSILEKLQSLGMIEIKQNNPEKDGVRTFSLPPESLPSEGTPA